MRKLKVLIGAEESVFYDVKIAAREFWGCDVVIAPDGKQVCAALRTGNFDLCILDWDLPRTSGLAVCHWIRSVNLKTQPFIVVLTEKARPEQINAAYTAGADDFLTKPFNAEDLHFLVSTLAQTIAQRDLASRQLTRIDPLELYRRDLRVPKIPFRF
jgi:DNA-binding response OmpR family regulator